MVTVQKNEVLKEHRGVPSFQDVLGIVPFLIFPSVCNRNRTEPIFKCHLGSRSPSQNVVAWMSSLNIELPARSSQ